jgi:hypothetical protein
MTTVLLAAWHRRPARPSGRLVLAGLTAVLVALVPLSSCKKAPRQKPMLVGDVNTGAGSLEATRKALEGTWTLVSLNVVDASGAQKPVKAKAQLTYDAYGSLTIKGAVDDDPSKTPQLLEYSGRIVIDTAKKQFYPADLVEEGQKVDPKRIAAVSPDKARKYEITADTLTITYMDQAGKPTAISSWKRATT